MTEMKAVIHADNTASVQPIARKLPDERQPLSEQLKRRLMRMEKGDSSGQLVLPRELLTGRAENAWQLTWPWVLLVGGLIWALSRGCW